METREQKSNEPSSAAQDAMWGFTEHSIEGKVAESEPCPDIACCSECNKKFDVADCPTEEDGDWESGYYTVHVCPECPDGGLVDDYDMSDKRATEWNEWHEQQKKRKNEK